MEKRVEFHSEGQKVVASLHLPENFKKPLPCVIASHGYKSNRNSEKYSLIGHSFSQEGIAVLRFDYRGALNGDSDGMFEDTTLTGRIKDLQSALDHLKHVREVDSNRVGLIGSSLGGMVVLALSKYERVKAVVTLATPYGFPRQREEMKISLEEKGYYEYPDGSKIKTHLYDDLKKYNMGEEIKKITCPILIIHGVLDEQVPRHHAFNLYNHANEPKRLEMIEAADHAFTDPNALNKVLDLSLEWFKKYLMS